MKKPLLSQNQNFNFVQPSMHEPQIQINDTLPSSLYSNQNQKQMQRKERYLKLTTVAFLISGFFYYRFFNNLNVNTNCILDSYQQYTFNINRKLYDGWDNAALGMGQVIMDFWIPLSAIFWMIKIKNFRLPLSVFVFYSVRSVFLLIEKFPFPPNMVWHSPGFYSLTVPYDHTRDFFYSGHTGSLTIILLEFSQFTVLKGQKWVGYIWVATFLCLIYMMNLLIISRVHYTADVIGGLVFSIYFYWLTCSYLKEIDQLISLPYTYIFLPLYKRVQEYKQSRRQNLLQSTGDKLDTDSIPNNKLNVNFKDQIK